METLYRKCCELQNQEQQTLARVEIVSPRPPQPRLGDESLIAIYVPVFAYQAISNNLKLAVQLVPQDRGHLSFRACPGMWSSHPFRQQGGKKLFVLASPLATPSHYTATLPSPFATTGELDSRGVPKNGQNLKGAFISGLHNCRLEQAAKILGRRHPHILFEAVENPVEETFE
ncbi:hypothetical protein B0T26DRAFT_756632 [Lasiosphaeria miniovina]|uniref:Uncharacterized protein n=1 Tax=Lasiosphaeria miniovina TaxID=1954250 RepID=A0AA39ZT20_9PEZI|nr:uncharacterized protein B0T26DRAFT_756632 [Lasiosphaeria miniovina]KAK0703050.1 hypothetical protein B0T26DRAFT_756632 [Lasiosphaeria miniovina]